MTEHNREDATLGIRENNLPSPHVLVIEDEWALTMLLEDMLAEIGCDVVGEASRFNDAMEKAKSLSFDFAILDINLRGRQTFAIAEALIERGRAFVFATGYDARYLPVPLAQIPIVRKPFQKRDLERVIGAALGH